MKDFFVRSALVTVLKTFSAIIKLLVVLFITNIFGAAEYGAFTFALTLFLFVNMLFRFGFDVYLQKKIAFFESIGKQSVGVLFLIKLIGISSASLITVTLIVELLLVALTGQIDDLKIDYLKSIFWLSVGYSMLWLMSYYFRGADRGVFSVLNIEIIFPATQLLLMVVLYYYVPYLTASQVIISSFITSIIVSCIIYLLRLKMCFESLNLRKLPLLFKGSKHLIKKSKPYLFISIVSMILVWQDIFVISFFENNESIGIYSVATKIGLFLLFPASAVAMFLTNRVVVCLARSDRKQLSGYLKYSTAILLMVSVIGVLVINIFAIQILSFFGDEFLLAVTVLLLFSIAQLLNAISAAMEVVFLMSELKHTFLKLNIFMIVINFILNVPMIYFWGIEGAALATLISVIISRSIQLHIFTKFVSNDYSV
jgi:O-antigen/teichoic acid export membrane protein